MSFGRPWAYLCPVARRSEKPRVSGGLRRFANLLRNVVWTCRLILGMLYEIGAALRHRLKETMEKTIDILGLGYTAVDELLYFDAYPQEDSKLPVRRRERHCGGLTATALVAAARLGCRCAYAGTLGDDDHSQFVIERFREEGIDVSHLRRLPDARPVRSTIIVDPTRQTRTILFDPNGVVQVDPHWPPEDVIRSARVLLVDHYGMEGMIRAAKIAREAGIPVVADFENADTRCFRSCSGLVDHLLLSRAFAQKLTGEHDPAAAARRCGRPTGRPW